MEQGKIIRVHRVGTVTFGCILILFGILFLAHIFVPWLHYEYVLRLWPLVFIFLGVEVLVGNHRVSKMKADAAQWKAEGADGEGGDGIRFVYDKTAIFLTMCLLFFAMVMAAVDLCVRCEGGYFWF